MVSRISVEWTATGTVPIEPRLIEKTTGTRATSAVSSLTAEERKFNSAIGARVTFRAQLNAVTFSGNSDRSGAIHWTTKNTEPGTRTEMAMSRRDPTKGLAIMKKTKPQKPNRPTIVATLPPLLLI